MKLIAENKSAHFEYTIEDSIEAGISLDGGEVKSVRVGQISLKDAYCTIYNGSVFVKNMHIAVYEKASAYNIKDDKRDRRLLLHRAEITKLKAKIEQKGYTLVPLKMYFNKALIKLEIGICKGKNLYDKKRTTMERETMRSAERDIKNYLK